MDQVFIAHGFSDAGRRLASKVEDLLTSHDLHAATGRDLGGQPLDDAVKRKIAEADALIALFTRQVKISDIQWTTHDWVRDEYGYAITINRRALAVVESGVQWAGMYHDRSFIAFESHHVDRTL